MKTIMQKGILAGALALFTSVSALAQTDTTTTVLSQTTPYQAYADEPVYKLKPAIDVPLTLSTAGLSILGFSKIYSKDASSVEKINSLHKSDLNGFDRWAADVYNPKAEKPSDAVFYAAMPLPLLLMLDKDIRKDGLKIGLLYLEAMGITGVFYTGSNYYVNRYRPLAYNSSVPMSERQEGGSTNSFIAGHPALVATSTFFTAKVFSDYNPDSKLKPLFWGAAILSTGATAYWRHRAGKHFPSDLIVGTSIGALSGILVPHFHKNKLFKNPNMSLTPFSGDMHGLTFRYKL